MFKDYFKDITITTLLLIYLYVCGALYLYGFWDTYDIEISSLVAITEIPKSFIQPFITTSLFYLLFSVLGYFVPKILPVKWVNNLRYRFGGLKMALFVLVFFVMMDLYSYFDKFQIYWYSCSFLLYVLLAGLVRGNEFLNKKMNNNPLKLYAIATALFIPAMCFATGKSEALEIFNNHAVHLFSWGEAKNRPDEQIFARQYSRELSGAGRKDVYTIREAFPAADTLAPANFDSTWTSGVEWLSNSTWGIRRYKYISKWKLIGFLGDKVVIAYLNNTNIRILKQDSQNQIDLSPIAQIFIHTSLDPLPPFKKK